MPDENRPMRDIDQPDRSTVARSPRLNIVDNALALTLLGRIRDRRTDTVTFTTTAVQLASLVLWEACRDIPVNATSGVGFAGDDIQIHRLQERVAGVLILRAGLLFAQSFRTLLPESPLYNLGLRRDEASLQPEMYYDMLLQRGVQADRVLLLDPMLATGGTACSAIHQIRQHTASPIDVICLVAAPSGVERVLETDQDCRIITIALDERLDEHGFIRPGLGDAGDRFFGTI